MPRAARSPPRPQNVRMPTGRPALEAHPCQGMCAWGQAVDRPAQPWPVFACSGCGSEWARTESWTPIGHDGQVPEAVRHEAGKR